jgi:hypothetical protein
MSPDILYRTLSGTQNPHRKAISLPRDRSAWRVGFGRRRASAGYWMSGINNKINIWNSYLQMFEFSFYVD